VTAPISTHAPIWICARWRMAQSAHLKRFSRLPGFWAGKRHAHF